MNRRTLQLVLVAALVAIAGCAGGMGGDPGTDATTDDSSLTDSSEGTGTASFYISDEPNVIDDFEHLNVTITKVGFKKTGSMSDGDSDGAEGDGTESENESVDDETDDEHADEPDGEEKDGDKDNEEKDGEEEDGEKEDDDKDGEEKDDDASEERWVEYDVNETTVDLTELKGTNASMIDEFELPAGEYETVFIYVSDTEGVMTDGTKTRVKLPSNKLQLHTAFTVGNNESVDFVYDIAPHKAGESGKYILKPVISQSGTGDDVEIRDVDEKDDEKTEGEEKEDDETKPDEKKNKSETESEREEDADEAPQQD